MRTFLKTITVLMLIFFAMITQAQNGYRLPIWGNDGSQLVSQPSYFLIFGVASNVTNNPPVVTAATLANSDVTWTAPDLSVTKSKTPSFSFFTNAGVYSLRVSDWSKVTSYTFAQATPGRIFVTNVVQSGVSAAQAGLTTVSYAYNTNILDLIGMEQLPVSVNTLASSYRNSGLVVFPVGLSNLINVTSLSYSFYTCYGLTGSIPDISTMTNCNTLAATFYNCTNLTGSIPDISKMNKCTTLFSTFAKNSKLTGSIPDISTMTNLTTFDSCFDNCSGLSGSIPNFSTLTKCNSLINAFRGCTGLTGAIPDISTMTSNTTLSGAFQSCAGLTGAVENIFLNTNNLSKLTSSIQCFYGLNKLSGNGMWFVNAPKSASYSVGTASTNSSYRTFYGCTNLSDYATIPAAYK